MPCPCPLIARLVSQADGADALPEVGPCLGLPYIDLKKGFAAVCREAKIVGLRWHDLRHTFGTRLGEAGFSEAVIAELMGHTSVSTTRRYTHGTERAKRAAVEAARAGSGTTCHNPATKEERPALRLAVSR